MKNAGAGINRILVVEDEPSIGQLCLKVLATEGFEVDLAVNGKLAQALLGKKKYDLCLIDIRTPLMDGKQLYQYIKGKSPKLAGRVIFTTGGVTVGDTQAFLELAGRPFLPKPFTPAQLKDIVGETLSQIEK